MFMQQCVCLMVDFGNVYRVVHPPNGGCWECSDSSLFTQWQISICFSLSVMSSIVGPEVFRSSEEVSPLMIILLMEVVMVSTYVRPVASSLTIQLELTLEIPGAITSPMDRVPMGTS